MLGLDDRIAGLSDGATLAIVLLVAVLLGLRHATDPDHLTAVTTLVASARDRSARLAARLGLAWGGGHAASLLAFGIPVVLFERYLPDPVQRGAETAVGVLIVALAVWLLVRWRRGFFHIHLHDHERARHAHLHSHERGREHARHPHTVRARTPLQAFGIGLVHGLGGSAGVGVLLLATVESRIVAVAALGLLAVFTAASMTLLTTGFGHVLASAPVRRSFHRLAPALGLAGLGFGAWYTLAALELAPYYL